MPAMRSDDAIEAISEAIRRESDAQMVKFEEYLSGKVSTRGLNSYERELGSMRKKVEQYAELLSVNLGDLLDRSKTILGGIQAARLVDPSEDQAAAVAE